jgi:hypothetical protein
MELVLKLFDTPSYEVAMVNTMLVPLPYLSHTRLNFPYIEGDRVIYRPNQDTLTDTIVLLYFWTYNIVLFKNYFQK